MTDEERLITTLAARDIAPEGEVSVFDVITLLEALGREYRSAARRPFELCPA